MTKRFNTVSVNDGTLNIEFIHVTQNPIICGIEVKGAVGGAPPPPPPVESPLPVPPFSSIYINAGSGTSTQGSGGITWAKDMFFNTGKSYSPKNSPSISGAGNSQAGTKDAFLYQSERYDDVLIDPDMIYEIPVPDGKSFSSFCSAFLSLISLFSQRVLLNDRSFRSAPPVSSFVYAYFVSKRLFA